MIGLLLTLYPARWRDRYGEEFAAVLEARPLGPFDVADILLGALDARLHVRGVAAASPFPGGIAMSLRIGGFAAIIGGLLWLVVFAGSAFGGSDDGSFLGGLVILVGTVALLIALAGLSAFQARRYPRLIWTAFAVPAAGALVSLVGLVASATVGDRPFLFDLSPWYVWMIGLVGLVVGSGLFAVATFRLRTLSRLAAGLLAVGAVIIVPVAFGIWGGLPPAVSQLLSLVAILSFGGGWVGLGASALRVAAPEVRPAGMA